MGLRARKIYALSLLSVIAAVLAAGTFLHAQDVTSGSYTVLKRYIFPRYNDDNEIQYVIYGATAVNKGSLIYLTTPMIDIVDGAYTSIRQIDTIDTKDPYPEPYELSAEIMELREFWTKTHHRHSRRGSSPRRPLSTRPQTSSPAMRKPTSGPVSLTPTASASRHSTTASSFISDRKSMRSSISRTIRTRNRPRITNRGSAACFPRKSPPKSMPIRPTSTWETTSSL